MVLIIVILVILLIFIYRNQIKQKLIHSWFQVIANFDIELHKKAGWSYLSKDEFKKMIEHSLPPINAGAHIFEYGCGVGAVLKYLNDKYKGNLVLSGSDYSENAISVARKTLPKGKFYVADMREKQNVKDNSQDFVLSYGAMGMYLFNHELYKTVLDAIRITKPGGSICITNLIEPGGSRVDSIVDPVSKDFWKKFKNIKNLKIFPMIFQGDRYAVTFIKNV